MTNNKIQGPLDLVSMIPFQNKNQWVMLFPAFANITPYVMSCTIPSWRFEVDEQTKFIRTFNWLENISITFREDNLGSVQMFLGILEALTWNRETKVFRENQSLAKVSAVLTMDELMMGIPTIGWAFKGLRYLGQQTLNLDYSSNDSLNIVADFSVENIFPMFPLNLMGALPIP